MLTSIADGLLCCLLGKTPNAVGPLDSVESDDGYTFLEVKPGRILRIRHNIPKRPEFPEEPEETTATTERGTVHCKRRITLYRNGQLLIENLGDAVRSEILQCHNASGDPNSTVELEMSDATGIPGKEGAAAAGKRRKRKPKKVVSIDCKKRITSCKGTHGDVVLFFIHGVGGSLDIWKEQLEFFSKLGYEVVAPDLAGHGCSSAPPPGAAPTLLGFQFWGYLESPQCPWGAFKHCPKKRNIPIGHSYGEWGVHPPPCPPPGFWDHPFPRARAGFARQGAKEKQLLKEGNAFNVSSFVLRAMMSGQYWPEGDEVYHAELAVPVLLVHGMHDKFVPVEEDQRMAE
ncbi:PREDICTED: protein ABHD8, partial [Corvus brachyrhynchos]|uniref:protein ABHD8 n=1 Tax=Corvus brachyrhynchos TaxID=85066 RepID=UPI000816644E